jgi:hypothetical protein
MSDAISRLTEANLRSLIAGLRSRRIASPFTSLQVARVVGVDLGKRVAAELSRLETLGFGAEQIAVSLELVLHDRQADRAAEVPIELVTSGPEAPGITNRDTSVVVRELFAHARISVLVVGYAVYQGQRVFETLAQRMEELPNLDVRLFLNIGRPERDATPAGILISRFVRRFKAKQWPADADFPRCTTIRGALPRTVPSVPRCTRSASWWMPSRYLSRRPTSPRQLRNATLKLD